MPVRVALVIPPSGYRIDQGIENICPNFGVLSLAAWLNEHKISVDVHDFLLNAYDVKLAEKLADYDIVGITTTADSLSFVTELVSVVKTHRKSARVILGGSLVSSYGHGLDNWIFNHVSAADIAVVGPGEDALLQIARGVEPTSIPNTICRARGHTYVGRSSLSAMRSLDDLPFSNPQVDAPLHARMLAARTVFSQTSRGCPFHCGFCFNAHGGDSAFSVSRAIADVKRLVTTYDPRHIIFLDSTFTANRERSLELLPELNRVGVDFSFETRVDCLQSDILAASAPRCREVFLGMEVFDDHVLKEHGKATTVQQIEAAVEGCRDNGILPRGFFILGLPGQTEETLRRTIRRIEKLRISCRARILIPLPGTATYKACGHVDDLALLTWLSEHSDTIDSVPPTWFNLSNVEFGALLNFRNRMNELGQAFLEEATAAT